jgi:hypothetical protein
VPTIVPGQEYDVWITEKALIYGIRRGRAHFYNANADGSKPAVALVVYARALGSRFDRRVRAVGYHFTIDAAKKRLLAMAKRRRGAIMVALKKLDVITRSISAGKLVVTEYADKER